MSNITKTTFTYIILLLCLTVTINSYANDSRVNKCLVDAVIKAKQQNKNTTAVEVYEHCSNLFETHKQESDNIFERQRNLNIAASKRGFSLLPHRSNYLLPITATDIENAPYIGSEEDGEYHDIEMEFQLSMKYLMTHDFIFDDLDLYFGFTSRSWWQAYNGDNSSPFRETNYEPELIVSYTHDWSLLGLTVNQTSLTFNHQSNGRSGDLSRSWNRIIGEMKFAPSHKFNWGIKGWWRIPEDEKQTVNDANGDDNPNIERYLGYGQAEFNWTRSGRQQWNLALRHNLRSKGKGAVQLGWSKPIKTGLDFYVKYFNGYGDGLIYFDQSTERLGIGVKLSNN